MRRRVEIIDAQSAEAASVAAAPSSSGAAGRSTRLSGGSGGYGWTLGIAEQTCGSRASLALLRWSLVIVFLWFGGMKFTSYEANGIAPLIVHSPIMGWLHSLFGVQGASDVIGIIELSTAAALVAGAFLPWASALGAGMSCLTFVITLTFLLSTPGVAEPTAGGFPAISAPTGQFLLKDAVLLAASGCLLLASCRLQRQERLPSASRINQEGERRSQWPKESGTA